MTTITESMDLKTLLENDKPKPEVGQLVEGEVIDIRKSSIYVDLAPHGTGIIYGREYMNAREIAKKVGLGDKIKANIVEKENENGYFELSLEEAEKAITWKEADDAIANKTVMELTVKEANKGGLMFDWRNIQAFLPASQLKSEHYPKVEDSDKDKILKELKKLVGKKLSVMMISAIPKEGKLILSEKETGSEERKDIIGKYNLGDKVSGEIAGIVDFGIFIKIEEGLEGLVHISEISHGLVDDLKTMFKIGQAVDAKVISIEGGKISLSMKALKENPWKEYEGKLKKGDIVDAVVIKLNKYGALASVKEGVAGLVHNSTFGSEEKLREKLELGKMYPFQVTLFEPENQKMTLTYLEK